MPDYKQIHRLGQWSVFLALLYLNWAGANQINFSENQIFSDSAGIGSEVSGGKISRRAKAVRLRQSYQLPTQLKVDTSRSVLELIRSLPRDSSARIAQFQYVRKDKPIVEIVPRKEYSLFLSCPPIVKYKVELDSSKWVYRIRMVVVDADTRIPLEVPFEVYTTLRLKQTIRQNWEALAQPYLLQEEKKSTLGDLMSKVTKIEVPIPKNPLFSIFGKNIIRMNIHGSIDIRGGFRHTKSDVYTIDPLARSQTSPDFQQEIMVGVKGEIGDKLKVDADWNTQRTFEYENQLHVRYEGYEDEIIKSIEAGNVSLPTKSSFFSGGQALFGIKANMQIGPLALTAVASQKKGQIKEMTVSGGREPRPFEKRLTEYSANHYFVDTSYIKFYETLFTPGAPTTRENMDKKIVDIEVWETRSGGFPVLGERNIVAFIDVKKVKLLQNDLSARAKDYDVEDDGVCAVGPFVKLEEGVDYDCDRMAGIISLRKYVPDDHAIAVAYVTQNGDTVGNSSQTIKDPRDTLKLIMKLVKAKALKPSQKVAWRLMLKNRYSLGNYEIDKSSFAVRLEYQLPGQTPTEEVLPQNIGLLYMFGLDRYTGDNLEGPDKVFDYLPSYTIDEARGEIIFPYVEPFSTEHIMRFLVEKGIISDTAEARRVADSLSFNAIYDTLPNAAVNDIHNRYYLRGNVQGAISDEIKIGFNVVEGSVEVISGGQRLTPNVDYTVDYIGGKVRITNQAYLQPGRELQVKYEANDLFQLASKSLVGVRGELDMGKNSFLGFTLMNYSQQSLSDKIRIGEEPVSNTIMAFDAGTTINTPWLTDALNFLPGIKTTAGSQISLKGEAAYMLPNPNTRKSPVEGDGDKGAAYIDDFEGAKQIIPIGEVFSMWRESSPPWYISTIDDPRAIGEDGKTISARSDNIFVRSDVEKMEYKGKLAWFNVYPTDVYISTIWGNRKSYVRGEDQVTALNFYFKPGERGAFNYSINLENTIGYGKPDNDPSHEKAWAGIQKILGMTTSNLLDPSMNIAFIEFWINVVKGDSTARINIDLGKMSEDIIPNRLLNTEDGLGSPNPNMRTGVLNPDFDWGLDTISDAREREVYRSFIEKYPQFANDPSGDDWIRPPEYKGARFLDITAAEEYLGVNGTEGNGQRSSGSDYGIFPDGEDFNRNNQLDRLNAYFEYEIPLNPNDTMFQKLVTGRGENNWYQIRIPIADYNRKIGEATFTDVEGVRVWITGARKPVLFRIVDFNLVGNQWEKRNRADSSYEVSVVNVEDNPNYKSPTGVKRQKDLSRPDQEIYGNEQSLCIIVKNLRKGESKEVVKNFIRPLDMFNYKTLKMFVHGDNGDNIEKGYRAFQYKNITTYDAEFFIRFGDDTVNYYEYRAPVHPGWVGNDVIIRFADLTAIKALRDTTNTSPRVPVEGGPEGATYMVRGNPNLSKIKFISIGITNPEGINPVNPSYPDLFGELWVNELRLTDVDDTPGWAYKFDVSVKLADVSSLSFSFSEEDPFFHGIEEHFGTRNTRRTWSFAGSLSFEKFLPESWNGSALTFTYSHSEGLNKPRYMPGQDDILVEEVAALVESQRGTRRTIYKDATDVRTRAEDFNVTDSYAFPVLRLMLPINSWIIRETINKMSFGYNYSESRSRNPSTEFSKSWNWNATFNYATDFSQENYFTLLGTKIFYTPKNLKFGTALSRNQSQSKARTETSVLSMNHSFTANRSMDFAWKFFEGKILALGLNYGLNITSLLSHLNLDKNGNFRPLRQVLGDIFFGDHLINFGKDQNYNQTMAFDIKLSMPKILSLDKVFTPNLRYSVNYRWVNNLQAGDMGKSAGWGNGLGFSLDINMKTISSAIWPSSTTSKSTDTTKGKGLRNTLKQLDQLTRILIKTPFFDFDRATISFSQQNSSNNNLVYGGPGFGNLFGRIPFFQSSLPRYGPSLLYQLGLTSDPNGSLIVKTRSRFPFITGYTVSGIRTPARSGLIYTSVDSYNQTNQLSFQTSRPLWEGASLQLNWSLGWGYNQQRSGEVDTLGNVTFKSRTVTGNINRSFISLPPVFLFKLFKNDLETVNEKYMELKSKDPENKSTTAAVKLASAFEEGLETLPWLSKLLSTFVPRANWGIQWSGLEKLPLFSSFAKTISLRHSYNSTYTESWRLNQQGKKEIINQRVSCKFAPLVEITIGFKEFWKGNLTGSIGYNTSTGYDLSATSQDAQETYSSGFSVNLGYNRRGFEIPLFGLSLSNNVDISFNYNRTKDKTSSYGFYNFQKGGVPRSGATRTSIEPNISYTLSDRVTARLYYKYSKYTPDLQAATSYGYTTTEGGLNIRITIQ